MQQYTLPNWVFKRDGRLVPFEADKISQSLFAATEALGRPNAFLARELTDGVLHFLAQETEGANPSTDQVAEIVAKVTRELGHPELARLFEEARDARESALPVAAVPSMPLDEVSPADSRAAARGARLAFARQAVFTRDLIAAFEDELLDAKGLEHPEAVDRLVLEPRSAGRHWGESFLEEMVRLRDEVARFFIVDSPDWLVAPDEIGRWTRHLCLLLEAMDRRAILNLNMATPPAWSREGGIGPLFSESARAAPADASDSERAARRTIEELGAAPRGSERLLVDWHLREPSLLGKGPGLPIDLAARLPRWRWSLDRPGQAISLGEGVDRDHPCLLMEIGLNLARFLHLDEVRSQLERFLDKLPSLVNMAISAGIQKRAYLSRAHSTQGTHLAQGFLLYRARIAVVPFALADVIRELLGEAAPASKAGLELEERILKTIRASAAHHGRSRNLEALVVYDDSRDKPAAPEEILPRLKQAWRTPGVRRVGAVGFL